MARINYRLSFKTTDELGMDGIIKVSVYPMLILHPRIWNLFYQKTLEFVQDSVNPDKLEEFTDRVDYELRQVLDKGIDAGGVKQYETWMERSDTYIGWHKIY